MILRKWIGLLSAAGLIAGGLLLVPGCGGEEGQPARGSISAPRKGGGLQDTAGEKFKTKPGGKAGGKAEL